VFIEYPAEFPAMASKTEAQFSQSAPDRVPPMTTSLGSTGSVMVLIESRSQAISPSRCRTLSSLVLMELIPARLYLLRLYLLGLQPDVEAGSRDDDGEDYRDGVDVQPGLAPVLLRSPRRRHELDHRLEQDVEVLPQRGDLVLGRIPAALGLYLLSQAVVALVG
jgi:hypothetical protein